MAYPVTKQAQHTQSEPPFLNQRRAGYFHDRVQNEWQGRHLFKGRQPQASSIEISSNDYLSLSRHPEIIQAQIASLRQSGNGAVMSEIFHSDEHPQFALQRQLASFLQTEDVLITQSGWCANTGMIQSIAGTDVPVFLDMRAHMSLWEGALSAQAKAIPFAHNQPDSLRRMLKRYGSGVVVVDSVYSAVGDVCPLADFADVCAAAR